MPSEPRATVAVLDDHAVVLDGIISWVERHAPDLEVAVRATTWLELVRSPRFPVDLVVMDFQLAEPVSIESRVRTCRAAGAAVVVVSALDSREARSRALDAGAAAFVPKSVPGTRVLDVVRLVLSRVRGDGAAGRAPDGAVGWGAVAFAPWLGVADSADEVGSETPRIPAPALSGSELTAVRLYVAGRTTTEVADAMGVSYETVKTYLRRVREKYARLDRPASRKSDLTRRVAEDGLLE
ncbi:response regulator transcription factor [Agromyces rhizosphaerae]|uniref:response regulator transcription factor n=1 Tax=Agromyces rhizosphaerae TaxID=88374 RepID=UPI0024939E3D|nr:response regulator [Agromyces rhizosphaerae]